MKKVLVFGYLPQALGGKQYTGLATGIFDLHNNIDTYSKDFQVHFAATDVNSNLIVEGTSILGWSRMRLLKHILRYPNRSLYFLYVTLKVLSYQQKAYFFKLVFLDYVIDHIKPDILHLHGSTGAMLSLGLWKRQFKVVLRLHGINGWDNSIESHLCHRDTEEFITSLHFDAVTFVTSEIQREWILRYGRFTGTMRTVLNGFDRKKFQPPSCRVKKKYDLITFSGISERKGQARVLEAINRLKLSGTNLSYLIIGDGNKGYVDGLKTFADKNDLNVTFIGYISQHSLLKYIHLSRYFILPSTTEGFGKVFIESIASGTPIIIPSGLPLEREKGVLNSLSTIRLRSSSIESISESLSAIDFSTDTNPFEISGTVRHLNWRDIAMEYSVLYHDILKI